MLRLEDIKKNAVIAGIEPHVLFLNDRAVRQGGDSGLTISRRVQFVQIAADGKATNAGWAPHLDLEPATEADTALIGDILNAGWITGDLEKVAIREPQSTLRPSI
jgi:hypothetical protein